MSRSDRGNEYIKIYELQTWKNPGAVTAWCPPRTYSVFLSLPRWGGRVRLSSSAAAAIISYRWTKTRRRWGRERTCHVTTKFSTGKRESGNSNTQMKGTERPTTYQVFLLPSHETRPHRLLDSCLLPEFQTPTIDVLNALTDSEVTNYIFPSDLTPPYD
jgi:hypothetical protein